MRGAHPGDVLPQVYRAEVGEGQDPAATRGGFRDPFGGGAVGGVAVVGEGIRPGAVWWADPVMHAGGGREGPSGLHGARERGGTASVAGSVMANRSLKSVAWAASPRNGITPKIRWIVRRVELWV